MLNHPNLTMTTPIFFFKVGKEQIKVFLSDILYIEGLKDYIKVFTSQGSVCSV